MVEWSRRLLEYHVPYPPHLQQLRALCSELRELVLLLLVRAVARSKLGQLRLELSYDRLQQRHAVRWALSRSQHANGIDAGRCDHGRKSISAETPPPTAVAPPYPQSGSRR